MPLHLMMLIQARRLIVNGGTLFLPCPHLFFRHGTPRPAAVRLQKEKPHSPLLWLAAGGNFANDTLSMWILQGISVGPARGPSPPCDPLFSCILTRKPRKIGFHGRMI